MIAIELLVDEILRLQNTVVYLQAQLREAKKMADFQGPNMSWAWYKDVGAKLNAIIASECDVADELLIVLMEDEIIHTDEHPFCDDPACPCHEEIEV